MLIKDFKVSYKTIDEEIRAQKMFSLRQKAILSISEGKYREARQAQKDFAKIAVEDFEIYKTLPNIHVHNVPLREGWEIFKKLVKFKIYRLFTRKTPEEKQLKRQYKEYSKQLTQDDKKNKTIDITIPSLY